jgi:hypothetical protein
MADQIGIDGLKCLSDIERLQDRLAKSATRSIDVEELTWRQPDLLRITAVLLISAAREEKSVWRDPPKIVVSRFSVRAIAVWATPEFDCAIDCLGREWSSIERQKWGPTGMVADCGGDRLSQFTNCLNFEGPIDRQPHVIVTMGESRRSIRR